MSDSAVQSLVACALALAGAALIHWLFRRIGRRLPILLTRRAGLPPAAIASYARRVALALVLPKVGLWTVVFFYVTDQIPPLRDVRNEWLYLLLDSLGSPLFTLNERVYTGLDLLLLPAALVLFWIGLSVASVIFRGLFLRTSALDRSAQETVALVTRYVLMLLGTLIILQMWGINISSLTIVASVLGVGIGFGLQNIANNFVSGLIINFERPVRLGDFVKVGEWMGTVEHIGARSIEIRTPDRVSILIPNSRFLETEVVNWSYGDPLTRLHVPVGVAYGSDVARVRLALLEAARNHPEVLRDPRPRVELRQFGASSLDFELLVWIAEPRVQERVKSDLNYRIETSLQRHGIEIPFSQHDLHLPQIERLLHAWARQQLGEEAAAALTAAPPKAADPDIRSDPEDDLPRVWSDGELKAVAERMRGEMGLAIRDRRHLLKVYPRCFVGREAVDWLVDALDLSRQEAVSVGQLMIDRGMLHHVLDEHPFRDGNFFYRFRADEG